MEPLSDDEFVLVCDFCHVTLFWVRSEVENDYPTWSEWQKALTWATQNVEHDPTKHKNLRAL